MSPCQCLLPLSLAVLLSPLPPLAPPLSSSLGGFIGGCRPVPALSVLACILVSVSVFSSLSVSLCLHLSPSPPCESPSPPYVSVPLVSVSLSSCLCICLSTPGAPACPLCPVSQSLPPPFSLPGSSAVFPSLSLSPSVSPSPPLSLCLSAPASPRSPPCPSPPAYSGSEAQMAGHSRCSACKHRAVAASGTSPHPRPLGLPGSSQSCAWSAGDSHSPLLGPQQSGIGTNSSLEETPCHH